MPASPPESEGSAVPSAVLGSKARDTRVPEMCAAAGSEVLPLIASKEAELVDLLSELSHLRHDGACVLVRVECVGAGGLLDLFDFEPVTRPTSSAALASAP